MNLLVIAKSPEPGRSKTRLSPPCSPEQAAEIARASLVDTLAAVGRTEVRKRIVVLDGESGPWVPPGFEVIPQCGGGLDARLAAAFEDVGGPSLLIGMDTPQVTPALLEDACLALRSGGTDAVLGEAFDGGWWAIGLVQADPRAFLDVPMSAPHTVYAQRARLRDLGLHVSELPRLRDVDEMHDARVVAAQIPRSGFAAAVERAEAGIAAAEVVADQWAGGRR